MQKITTMSSRTIPVVDLSKFVEGDSTERTQFVKEIGAAFHNVGFVGVRNHGIPMDLVDGFYNGAKRFFSLPVQSKKQYDVEGLAGQRGYTAFGKEHAKQSNVGDLKEFFQIGQTVEDEDNIKGDYPDNLHTIETPEFTYTGRELFKAFEAAGGHLLAAIAIHLNLGESYFTDEIHNGNSILRAIHYPPITKEPKSAIRSEEHEDINLITLLFGASAGGLQLLNTENEWMDILPGEDEIVINVGDMLQRMTNNYLISTTHRVINPPKEKWHVPRISIPFFLHPRSDTDLTCLDVCISEDKPLQYPPITAGAYLDERLREIGLK